MNQSKELATLVEIGKLFAHQHMGYLYVPNQEELPEIVASMKKDYDNLVSTLGISVSFAAHVMQLLGATTPGQAIDVLEGIVAYLNENEDDEDDCDCEDDCEQCQ